MKNFLSGIPLPSNVTPEIIISQLENGYSFTFLYDKNNHLTSWNASKSQNLHQSFFNIRKNIFDKTGKEFSRCLYDIENLHEIDISSEHFLESNWGEVLVVCKYNKKMVLSE